MIKNFQNEHFGMFIVLTLHRENLREMMDSGRLDLSMKREVLEMLKPIVCSHHCHGDIKEFCSPWSFIEHNSKKNMVNES